MKKKGVFLGQCLSAVFPVSSALGILQRQEASALLRNQGGSDKDDSDLTKQVMSLVYSTLQLVFTFR